MGLLPHSVVARLESTPLSKCTVEKCFILEQQLFEFLFFNLVELLLLVAYIVDVSGFVFGI